MLTNETAARILPTSTPARKRVKRVVATATAPVKRRGQSRQAQAALSARKRLAIAVGSVGCVGLLLSLWHCSEAICMLTGMPVQLAVALAIMVDCGMVVCEVSAVMAEPGSAARYWAYAVILLVAALSTGLNSLASGEHAPEGYAFLAYAVGAVVPMIVFGLFQVASHLWTE